MGDEAFAPSAHPPVPDKERDHDAAYCECGAELFWAPCHMIDCWDGEYDLGDEDPINYPEGTWVQCEQCEGRGGFMCCPNKNHPAPEVAA